MKTIKQLCRLIYIQHVFSKNGLDKLLVSVYPVFWLKLIVFFNPWHWFCRKQIPQGEALRYACEALGPIFVKFGQALSTRPDILPEEMAIALSQLQDRVKPFSSEAAYRAIETAFSARPETLFASFETTALASASVAQVHAATLKTGQNVVVKILRPGIQQQIEQDIALLKMLARLMMRCSSEARRFKPLQIVEEFELTLRDELDLRREAANANLLRRHFEHSPLLYVPTVHWDFVRDTVLVMERIHGIPVNDKVALIAQGVDLQKLAAAGVEIFFTQVFRDSFFHADMHPGNIFVSYEHPASPQYICVDFGIMGTLSDEDKRYLAENLIAFFNRDYRRVAQLHIESGWVAPETRVEAFEGAIRTVCEPIFQKPLKDISFGLVVLHLLQVARRYNMQIQPQLVLFQKTLLAVEGLGRQIAPDLDLWKTAKPFLEKWAQQQFGPRALLRHMKTNIPFFVEQLPYLPRLLHDVLVIKKAEAFAVSKGEPLRKKSLWKPYVWGFIVGLLVCTLYQWGVHRWG